MPDQASLDEKRTSVGAVHERRGHTHTPSLVPPNERVPFLLRAADQVPSDNIRLPLSDSDGYQRIWHRGVNASQAWARLCTFPPGQRSPIHAVTIEHIIYMVSGRLTFRLRDTDYDLAAGDLFYFPAIWLYTVENTTDSEASFISVGVPCEYGWPPDAQYWVPDETSVASLPSPE